MPAPSCLASISSSFAPPFRTHRRRGVPRDLPHRSADYLRLARALDISVQGRVSHLHFAEQRIKAPAKRFVARQLAFVRNAIELLVERFSWLQPHGPPRVVGLLARSYFVLGYELRMLLHLSSLPSSLSSSSMIGKLTRRERFSQFVF